MNKKRQDISNDQKQEICRFARDHPTKKQVDIIDWFYDKYKIKLPKTTISGILKKKETYLNTDIVNKFRDRKAKFPELERALFLWFCDKRANFICISDQILVEQAHKFANEFYSQFEIEDFKFSEGWIQKFKKRNNISLHSVQGEAASVDMSNLEIEREKLKQLTGQYDPADIFNLDETALFYRLQPNKTLSNTKAIGTKQEKNRITVALCCNALGTEKLKPIVICKNKKPRCFKDFDPNVKTYFYHNTKAWMTSLIFSDFVEKWNNYLNFFFPNRKVLLLVDNAGGHNMTKTVFSHIKIHYLPPNMTSMIQPLDAGIIKSFKSHYKKYLLNFLIDSIEINNTVEPPSVKEAIDMTVKAWHKVSRQTIHNCWIHCDILQHNSLVTSELVPDLGLAPLLDSKHPYLIICVTILT